MPVTVPDFNVKINGADLPFAAQADVASVTVVDDVDALSMFALELYNWDQEKLEVSWSDGKLFDLGHEVAIRMGTVDDLHPVMTGEVTSLEPSFGADGPPMLTVRGYDRRHRLARGRRTRTFSKMKDSAIVSQLARDAGLQAKATDTKVTLEYVVQHDETDLEFLRRRAGLIGYEVYVLDKVLHFRPPQHATAPTVTLTLGEEITEFTPRLRAADQVDELTVRGWDVTGKRAVVGTARSGQESTTMGGTVTGPRQAARAFGKAASAGVGVPIRTKARGDQMAVGRLDEIALQFVQGEATCGGDPRLRAGSTVTIEGAGKRFSGRYYITAVTHTLSPTEGYRTRVDVRRNAS
jgi:uncharacterized protein